MQTTERLLAAADNIWQQYNEHPFVLGIQDGSLSRQKFRYYIIQDYMYLIDYAKVFAIGVAKAKSVETQSLFGNYISAINNELNIHDGYMGKLGITMEEIADTPRALANLSYTSYMLRVAYEGTEVEILTAILACAYSYEVIARQILANCPNACRNEFFGEWISGYAGEEYSAENRELLATLNRLTANYDDIRLAYLEEIFIACSRYELDFWQMAWEMSK